MRVLSISVIKSRVTSLKRIPVAYAVSNSARSRSAYSADRDRWIRDRDQRFRSS
jgi:hypothetical protein